MSSTHIMMAPAALARTSTSCDSSSLTSCGIHFTSTALFFPSRGTLQVADNKDYSNENFSVLDRFCYVSIIFSQMLPVIIFFYDYLTYQFCVVGDLLMLMWML